MVNENCPYSSSEMLYGTSLRMPGEYFHLSTKPHSPIAYIFDACKSTERTCLFFLSNALENVLFYYDKTKKQRQFEH